MDKIDKDVELVRLCFLPFDGKRITSFNEEVDEYEITNPDLLHPSIHELVQRIGMLEDKLEKLIGEEIWNEKESPR